MTVFFTAVVIFDGWLDGSLAVQGTVFCILVALLAIPAQLELSKLAAAKKLKIFIPVSIIASILFATSRYWQQEYWQRIIEIRPDTYLILLSALVLLALLLYQYISNGTSGVLANCGASYFSILYLGLLSSFCVSMRLEWPEFGVRPLLMFVFVVKSADIGAYAIGSLFGKHKFSPKISPSKSWEGMGGAVGAAMIVAVGFALSCDIMVLWSAVIFGV